MPPVTIIIPFPAASSIERIFSVPDRKSDSLSLLQRDIAQDPPSGIIETVQIAGFSFKIA
jgi:hypothetical protein